MIRVCIPVSDYTFRNSFFPLLNCNKNVINGTNIFSMTGVFHGSRFGTVQISAKWLAPRSSIYLIEQQEPLLVRPFLIWNEQAGYLKFHLTWISVNLAIAFRIDRIKRVAMGKWLTLESSRISVARER